VLAGFLFFSALWLAAQTSPGSISGRVVLPNGNSVNETVRISLETLRGVRSSGFTDNQGQFNFRGLAPGSYQVVVEADRNRFEMTSVRVEVLPGFPSILTITLKERKSSRESRSGRSTVSATELDTDIPEKAHKEFERAGSASKEGKTEEAIVHLRKAIEIYPAYLMAYNDLGVQLLAQGKLDEAVAELRRAVALDPKAFNPNLNLGIVLVHQQDFLEAADTLRKALSLESNSPAARLYMGKALSGLDDSDGAARELKIAHDLGGAAYAVALFDLGQIYLNRGDRKRALETFELYLSEDPKAANAAEVRKLIQILQ
jgi:tetratricopeptide (TPR) repeat protein